MKIYVFYKTRGKREEPCLPPPAVFQELVKGHCYTIYQDPPTGKYYLMIDMAIYAESGIIFKSEISTAFQKLAVLKGQQTTLGKFSYLNRH